jgi:hypothetical protein
MRFIPFHLVQGNWLERASTSRPGSTVAHLVTQFNLSEVHIPRWVGFTERSSQFHVFCDSSERAYGAAFYIRATEEDKTRTFGLQQEQAGAHQKGNPPPIRVTSGIRGSTTSALLLHRDRLRYRAGATVDKRHGSFRLDPQCPKQVEDIYLQ